MYTSDAEIRDTTVLAAPVSQLFLCDENDQILKVSLKAPNTTSLILEPNTTSLRPWALSADWLNGWLYVAGANDATGFWEISRCDFDGRKLKGLLPGLMDQPIKLEVDPVNGYLFWKTNDSIYRVDLADFEKEPNQAQVCVIDRDHGKLNTDQNLKLLAGADFEKGWFGCFHGGLRKYQTFRDVSAGKHR